MSKPLIISVISFILLAVKYFTGTVLLDDADVNTLADIVLQIGVFVGAYLHKRKENGSKSTPNENSDNSY